MSKAIIKLNGKDVVCDTSQTVLQVARENDIEIPNLCYHPDFCVKANCRVCVVEIVGRRGLQTSCSTKVENGMEVYTNTERVERARNINIELIYAEHIEKCFSCVWRFECKLLSYARDYKTLITRFKDRKNSRRIYRFEDAVEIDGSQCIDCRNCIDACSTLQKINYLTAKGKGKNQEIQPVSDKDKKCILCGQCAVHCPVSAAQEQTNWEQVEKEITDEKKLVIAQVDTSIPIALGEDFGDMENKLLIGQISSGLKAIGFDYVVDSSFAFDLFAKLEADDLASKIKNKKNNFIISSFCPSTIKYLDYYAPNLKRYLSKNKNPHLLGADIIKSYIAQNLKIDLQKVVVVSISACVANKNNIKKRKLSYDYSLTTRELSFLFKKNNIDLLKIKKIKPDFPDKNYSSKAIISNRRGGLTESIIRLFKKENNDDLLFSQKAIDEGAMEVVLNNNNFKLKFLLIDGIGHVGSVVNNFKDYDYIELLTCPHGCVGGGGQPIPTNRLLREHRSDLLNYLSEKKKGDLYESKLVDELVDYLNNK